nr:MAG: helix-turn-helix domain protein [Bacteriophage sp.]
MTIGDRIIEIRKEENLSQEEFGKKIGLSRSIIGCYEKNIRNVSDRTIRDICSNFNVNEDWLRTGNGDKEAIPKDIHDLTKVLSEISLSDNIQLHKITSKLLNLDEKYLVLIENLIDALIEK